MSHAFELLFAQVAKGKTKQQIAVEIGYSRTTVSLYMSGNYHENPAALEKAVLACYDRRECPYTGEAVAPETCRTKALAPKPFGGRARQDWWAACQTCTHKPEGDAK